METRTKNRKEFVEKVRAAAIRFSQKEEMTAGDMEALAAITKVLLLYSDGYDD